MGKALEGLGDYEYVMLTVTMIGVIYIIMKMNKISLSQDGMMNYSAGAVGFDTTLSGDNLRDRRGFSVGSMEAPVFNMTAFDPHEMNQAEELRKEKPDSEGMTGLRFGKSGMENKLLNALAGQ